MAEGCHYCGTTEREMRPYGPSGSRICFPCMKASPEREKAAEGAFGALLDATAAMSGGPVAIGTEQGPIPFEIPTDAHEEANR